MHCITSHLTLLAAFHLCPQPRLHDRLPAPPAPPTTPQVEAHFIASGYLLPTFHTSYWLGLTSSATAWPAFTWLDPYMAPLTGSGSVYRCASEQRQNGCHERPLLYTQCHHQQRQHASIRSSRLASSGACCQPAAAVHCQVVCHCQLLHSCSSP